MKRLLPLALGSIAIAGFALLGLEEGPDRYLATGSSTLAPLIQAVAEKLHDEKSGWVIEVQTGGSGRGIADIRAGNCNLGMASRDLSAEERAGIVTLPIAYDGVALITSAENPCDGLTREQVIGIYTGAITNWSAVGGDDVEIDVINKAEGRATLAVFLEHFGLRNSAIQARAVIGDNAQGIRLVTGNAKAIAYVSVGEALSAQARGERIRLPTLDEVIPSLASVGAGSYPLRRTLYLLFADPLSERDHALQGYLRSTAGQALIARLGFVPVRPTD